MLYHKVFCLSVLILVHLSAKKDKSFVINSTKCGIYKTRVIDCYCFLEFYWNQIWNWHTAIWKWQLKLVAYLPLKNVINTLPCDTTQVLGNSDAKFGKLYLLHLAAHVLIIRLAGPREESLGQSRSRSEIILFSHNLLGQQWPWHSEFMYQSCHLCKARRSIFWNINI